MHPPSRTSSRSGLQRTVSQTQIHFDLSNRHSTKRTNIIGPEPSTPDRQYNWKLTPSPAQEELPTLSEMARYLPYSFDSPHYKLDKELTNRYTLDVPFTRRISLMQSNIGDNVNDQRRWARTIARVIYQRGTPHASHMSYLSAQDEDLCPQEMILLDHLCLFIPEHLVLINGQGIPTTCHSDKQTYWDLINMLANRRQQATHIDRQLGPSVPEWPRLEDSFDNKQFAVAAVLFRDEVTRFLAYYLKQELNRAMAASFNFDGFSLSRVLDRRPAPRNLSAHNTRPASQQSIHSEPPYETYSSNPPEGWSRSRTSHADESRILRPMFSPEEQESVNNQLKAIERSNRYAFTLTHIDQMEQLRKNRQSQSEYSEPSDSDTSDLDRTVLVPTSSISIAPQPTDDDVPLSPPHSLDSDAPPPVATPPTRNTPHTPIVIPLAKSVREKFEEDHPIPKTSSAIAKDNAAILLSASRAAKRIIKQETPVLADSFMSELSSLEQHPPGAFPGSPQPASTRSTALQVEIPDHRSTLEDLDNPEGDEEPVMLLIDINNSSSSVGTIQRVAQTHEEAQAAAKEFFSPKSLPSLPSREPTPIPSGSRHKGKDPSIERIEHIQQLRAEGKESEAQFLERVEKRLEQLKDSSVGATTIANASGLIPPRTPNSTPRDSPEPQEQDFRSLGKDLRIVSFEQYGDIATSASSQSSPELLAPAGIIAQRFKPQSSSSPSLHPVSEQEELEEESDIPSSVTSYATRTRRDWAERTRTAEEYEASRAEICRQQREQESERRRQERAQLEEERLARQQENVNAQRGRYSHARQQEPEEEINPLVDSSINPENVYPRFHSTPQAKQQASESGPSRPKARPSATGIPAYINRMQGTGLADLVGTSNPPPPVPPVPSIHSVQSSSTSSHSSPRESPPHSSHHSPAPTHESIQHGSSFASSNIGYGRDDWNQHNSEQSRLSSPILAVGGRGPPEPPNDDSDSSSSSSSSSTDSSRRRRRRHQRRRQRNRSPDRSNTTDQNPAQQNWRGPLPLHIEPKLKISDLPEFKGTDEELLTWFIQVNGLADQSEIINNQLGQMLPHKFKERAFMWYHSLPLVDQIQIRASWTTLKAAISAHFMNSTWIAAQRTKAQRMRFRDHGNSDELPIDYVLRKKMHLTLITPMPFDQLIHEIIIGAPAGWQTILRIDDLGGQWTEFINRVHNHSQALIDEPLQQAS
ncbi:hypothetical protein RhiJN_23006 [Ceratobasidium sp. AG-Ba]|nr:hypothetical protein RhiJN_23006 [Ceratobasidium sp. AG-Ba]